jgi:hypothetical protein
MSYACADGSQRQVYDENQKSHPHPQILSVFLVGTVRRNEPYRLHAIVHRTRDAGHHSNLHSSERSPFITHTQSTLPLSKRVTMVIRSTTNIPNGDSFRDYCDACGTGPGAASGTDAHDTGRLR